MPPPIHDQIPVAAQRVISQVNARPSLLVAALLAVALAPFLAVISPLLLGFPMLLLVAILVTSQKACYTVTVFPEHRQVCKSFQSSAPDECLTVDGNSKVRLYAWHHGWRYLVLVVSDDVQFKMLHNPNLSFPPQEFVALSSWSYERARRVAEELAADLTVPVELDPPMSRLMTALFFVIVMGGISLL